METYQAIEYLETVDAAGIKPRTTSRAMFKFLRGCARIARRNCGGMSGYYPDGHTGPQARIGQWLYRRPVWSDIDPRSIRLQNATSKFAPQEMDIWKVFGIS